jgi:hypothetical protein
MTIAQHARTPYPPISHPASAFHLTPEQVQFFDDHGYLLLKQQVTGKLLQSIQQAGMQWIDDGLKAPADSPHRADYQFARRPAGQVFYRVDYLHNKGCAASLDLLGSPQVLAVAESLCGRNFVPTYESMVFKMKGDGEVIPWHQDAVHARRYRVFNYDLYLDHSRSGAGALWVVPGSHRRKQDVCDVADKHGWRPPGAIEVEMEPGDVLLHDVMVVHGSPRAVGAELRRTVYYEFRSAEMILEEGPWDMEWIHRRMRFLPVALKRFAMTYPMHPQFDWTVDERFRPEPVGDEAAELRVAHVHHTPGSFCSATSEGSLLPKS